MAAADEVEERAYGGAIHWASGDDAWYRLEGDTWRGYTSRADGTLEECERKPSSWRPWSQLLDDTKAPAMSWFVGAKTNATFTALDYAAHVAPEEVAFEHVAADDATRTITRRELLLAVSNASRQIENLGPRFFLHMRVGLEHVVFMLACARLAFPYTCSALDATDGALEHRIKDFFPTCCLTSPDGEVKGPGSKAATRMRGLTNGMEIREVSFGEAETLARAPLTFVRARPVGDSAALCVVFTSGSTGKPKGVVHSHGGYTACVARSTVYAFDQADETDTFLTVATFAWITGQSYMLMAPLLCRAKSILMEGSPVGHDGLRWARVAKDRKATILKMASSFARQAMVDATRRTAVEELGLKLRLGTFCAEPVSEDVLAWARTALCPHFFNSYWATEHGSIVLTKKDTPEYYANAGTKCYPVPWVEAALLPGDTALRGIVLTKPYAGLARTVWSAIGHGEEAWRGDTDRYAAAYFPDGTFVQGDSAILHSDGGFSFHGRSDEVLNVSGVRVGVEELEKCAYSCAGQFDLSSLAIVGAPSELEGEVPVAFVVSSKVDEDALLAAFREKARGTVGAHAEPRAVLVVSAIPLTITGKPCRALLKAALQGEPRLSKEAAARSIKNLEAYDECCEAAAKWLELRRARLIKGKDFWARYDFDGHDVFGGPLLPATGWLTLLKEEAYPKAAALCNVEFKQQARERTAAFTSTAVDASSSKARLVVTGATGQEFVRCEVLLLVKSEKGEQELNVAAWAEEEILEDYGPIAHYRRCLALGLAYKSTFRCVERVGWSTSFGLRILVSAEHLPAMLDAPLQAICSMESLGRGTAFLPQSIASFELLKREHGGKKRVLVIAEITSRRDTKIVADLAWYEDEDDFFGAPAKEPFARMTSFAFARSGTDRRPRREPAQQPVTTALVSNNDALTMQIASLASEVVGATIDVSKTLYENGLHSLRAVELVGRLNGALGVELRPKDFAAVEDVGSLVEVYAAAIALAKDNVVEKKEKFAHVDRPALQKIIDARLSGAEASTGTPRKPAHREAFRAAVYMMRRGFVRYTRIQYRDGLFHFLLDPPKKIDLTATTRVPGARVLFEQTDYNRHFTVREIIRDSERGFYNLVHKSGLAHLEHYFRVMFFASRLSGRFDLELLQGEAYEMRCSIGSITGPLVDVNIEFVNQSGDRCFLVTWRLMLVVDASKKLMYDFERGGVFGSEKTASSDPKLLPKKPKPADEVKLAVTYRTWFGLVALVAYVARYVWSHTPAFVYIVTSSLDAARNNFSAAELYLFIALAALAVGVEFGLWSSEKPIQGLLPHG